MFRRLFWINQYIWGEFLIKYLSVTFFLRVNRLSSPKTPTTLFDLHTHTHLHHLLPLFLVGRKKKIICGVAKAAVTHLLCGPPQQGRDT